LYPSKTRILCYPGFFDPILVTHHLPFQSLFPRHGSLYKVTSLLSIGREEHDNGNYASVHDIIDLFSLVSDQVFINSAEIDQGLRFHRFTASVQPFQRRGSGASDQFITL
jgi:hypothetical protein